MRFEPKTKEQIQEEKILPAGDYAFTVAKAEEGKSKKGQDMITLQLTVFTDSGAKRAVRDWLGAWTGGEEKILGFCEAVGLSDLYMSGMFSAEDCIGVSGFLKLRVQESEQYGSQNQVQYYIPRVDQAKRSTQRNVIAAAMAPAEASGEDLPF